MAEYKGWIVVETLHGSSQLRNENVICDLASDGNRMHAGIIRRCSSQLNQLAWGHSSRENMFPFLLNERKEQRERGADEQRPRGEVTLLAERLRRSGRTSRLLD